MTGKYSAVDLAGVAIGSNIWVAIFTGIGGVLTGLTPIVSQAFGAKDHERISRTIEQAIYLAIVFACFVLTIIYFLVPILLENMYIESNVQIVAHQYLQALCIGIIPIFIYYVLRSFMDALGQTKVTMMLTLCSLPLNVLLNDIFIFGRWGIPAFGESVQDMPQASRIVACYYVRFCSFAFVNLFQRTIYLRNFIRSRYPFGSN